MLYAIQVGEDGPMKLGWSDRPLGRLQDHQVSNHEQLQIRAVWPGGHADEQRLHRLFADAHRHGEWSDCTRELRDFVAERADGDHVAIPDVPRPTPPTSSRRYRPDVHVVIPSSVGPVRRARDPDAWIAKVCDMGPALTAEHLLGYLVMLEHADESGQSRVDLATLAARAIGELDLPAAGRLVLELYNLALPDATASCDPYPAIRLATELLIEVPPYLKGGPLSTICPKTGEPKPTFTALEGMVANGRVVIWLARHAGVRFGEAACPASFPVDNSFRARHAWARDQIGAAQKRASEFRRRHDAP